jgi:hypothetical protein
MPEYLYTTPATYRGKRVMIDAEMLILSYPPRYMLRYANGHTTSALVHEVTILRFDEPSTGVIKTPNRDS